MSRCVMDQWVIWVEVRHLWDTRFSYMFDNVAIFTEELSGYEQGPSRDNYFVQYPSMKRTASTILTVHRSYPSAG